MHSSRILVATMITGLLLAYSGEASGQQGILISPQLSQIELSPGGTRIFEITVANSPGNAPVTLDIKVAPIAQDDHGSYTIARTDNAWSCAAWTEIDRVQISLGPGESQTVRCKIKVPSDAAGGRYGAVVFSFRERYRQAAGISQNFTYQLASFIEVTITRTRTVLKAQILDLSVSSVVGNTLLEKEYGKDAFFIAAKVTNEGNIGVFGKATLRIREQRGLHVREVPLGEGRGMVLPGQTVEYRSLFKERPPAGNYSAEATLTYGGIRPAVAKVAFSVTRQGELKAGSGSAVQVLGLDITPRSFDVVAPPGSRKTVGVTLNNVEQYPVKVSAAVLGFEQTADGRFVAAANAAPPAEAGWINIDPASFEVPAQTRKRIKIEINVPESTSGARYLRVAFKPEDPNVSKEALQESYSADIFLSIPPDITRDVTIDNFNATAKGRFSPVTFSFGANNQGNCHVDIDASLTIKDPKSVIVREIRLLDRNTRILPGLTRVFAMEDTQGFESGVYNCQLVLKIGKGKALYSTCTLKI
jgi:hypothetical protein